MNDASHDNLPNAKSSRGTVRLPSVSRRTLLIGGVLAAASGVAYARQPEVAARPVPAKRFDSWVPKRFGPWSEVATSGVVLPPPDTLRDRLYDNLVTRVYQAPGREPVMFLMAYNNAQDGVLQVHRPEVCYPVGGYTLTDTREVPLPTGGQVIPANFFTATGPDRVEQVFYFTRLGDAYPRNWAEQRLTVIRANLAGRIPDGIMLRVSVLGTDAPVALRGLQQFADQFIEASAPPLRRLLLA